MATISEAIQKLIVARFAPGIREALVEEEPTFAEINDESIGVKQDDVGQNWKVIHTFVTSVAGALKAVAIAGGNIAVGTGTGETAVVYSTPRTFPGINEFVSPGYLQRTITLQQWMGNMYLPHQLLRADRLTASIGSAVAMVIKQTARMVAQIRANVFFTEDQTYKSWAQVKSLTSGGTSSDTTATIVIEDTDQLRRLTPGILVDVLDASNSYAVISQANSSYTLIRSVDPINRTVVLATTTSSSPFSATIAAGDRLCLKDSKSTGPDGFPSWMVASGTLFGATIDTAYYPQFRSIVPSSIGAPLDDQTLFKYIGGFVTNWGNAWAPDTILTTPGVLNAYIGNFDDLRRFDAYGRSQQITGGGKAMAFDYNGRSLRFRTSALVQAGYAYGIRLTNNIKRYVPPRLPDAGSNGVFNRDIEFTAPLGGSRDIWKHAHSSSLSTEFVEAPFVCCEQYCPEVVPGVKLSGLTEVGATS